MDRLTHQKWSDDIDLSKELGYKYIYQRLWEIENTFENGRMVELPCNWLATLKLLTISAICYKKWKDIIIEKIKGSEDIKKLFVKLSIIEYSHNDFKLQRLVDSNIDVNKINGIEEIINIFYPEQAENALKEMEGNNG